MNKPKGLQKTPRRDAGSFYIKIRLPRTEKGIILPETDKINPDKNLAFRIKNSLKNYAKILSFLLTNGIEHLSRIDHMLGKKKCFIKFKNIRVISCIFSGHKDMTL